MEQAVIVHLRLSDHQFGSQSDRKSVGAMEEALAAAIHRASAGEFDGDEFGERDCVLFMYGPSADRLYDAISPILESSVLRGHAVRRYGAPGSREVRSSVGLAET